MSSIKRVSVVSTGTVDIHPQHLRSDGAPPLWWLLTSRRWTGPRPAPTTARHHPQDQHDAGAVPDLVILPAHDPGATGRLAAAEQAPASVQRRKTCI